MKQSQRLPARVFLLWGETGPAAWLGTDAEGGPFCQRLGPESRLTLPGPGGMALGDAAEMRVLLPGHWCRRLRVWAPGRRRPAAEALLFAAEEELAADPETLVAAVEDLLSPARATGSQGRWWTLTVVAQARLQSVLSALEAAGLRPAGLHDLLGVLPAPAEPGSVTVLPMMLTTQVEAAPVATPEPKMAALGAPEPVLLAAPADEPEWLLMPAATGWEAEGADWPQPCQMPPVLARAVLAHWRGLARPELLAEAETATGPHEEALSLLWLGAEAGLPADWLQDPNVLVEPVLGAAGAGIGPRAGSEVGRAERQAGVGAEGLCALAVLLARARFEGQADFLPVSWRRAGALGPSRWVPAVVFLVLGSIAMLAQPGWQGWQAGQAAEAARAEILAVASAALPQTRRWVNPRAQLAQALRDQGEAVVVSPGLSLLGAAGPLLQGQGPVLTRMTLRASGNEAVELELGLTASSFAELQGLVDRGVPAATARELGLRALSLDLRDTRAGENGQVIGRLVLKEAS